jgi:SPP1 family predicted phage head-tail adaptor
MRAGELRHRITIEHATEVQDEYGEPLKVWAPFVEAWASREDLTGREAFQAQQVRAELTTRFGMRYVDGITAKMRVNAGGVLYDIASVADPEGRGRTLIIMAERQG